MSNGLWPLNVKTIIKAGFLLRESSLFIEHQPFS